MGMAILEDKCATCIYAWTDECPRRKCFENNYKYYVKEQEDGNGD